MRFLYHKYFTKTDLYFRTHKPVYENVTYFCIRSMRPLGIQNYRMTYKKNNFFISVVYTIGNLLKSELYLRLQLRLQLQTSTSKFKFKLQTSILANIVVSMWCLVSSVRVSSTNGLWGLFTSRPLAGSYTPMWIVSGLA